MTVRSQTRLTGPRLPPDTVLDGVTVLDCFPLDEPRDVQVRALDHFLAVVEKGYRDIVIAAPTGAGKSAMLLAICQWAHQLAADEAKRLNFTQMPGGYYLTAQKLLQDQIEKDTPHYRRPYHRVASLKSSVEYPCARHKTCNVGRAASPKCESFSCAYKAAKAAFVASPAALTNYAYFFTERYYSGQLPGRRVLAVDEAHRLEGEVLKFVDIRISNSWLEKYVPGLDVIPATDIMGEALDWIETQYLPAVREKHAFLLAAAQESNAVEQLADDLFALENHINKVDRAMEMVNAAPEDWLYWQEESQTDLAMIIRPLDAAPFFKDLVKKVADVRVYASAFPGSKEVFCRSLGLRRDEVCWMGLPSDFSPKRRPVVMLTVGSMGRQSQESTLPAVVKISVTLAKKHATQKGLIHAHSYALANQIYEALNREFPGRCLYPRQANERETLFNQHMTTTEPTILISPSMGEGFDFKNDLARWQIIPKCPWPSLSDRRTKVMLERDPEWYRCEALKSFLQACGRVVRSRDDHGITYVLDSDVRRMLDQVDGMVPKWFKASIVEL